MRRADIVLLLHTHMPYVRRNGDWPVGEEWLLEAWAESYIPIWRLIEDLTEGRLPGRISLTMTPVLAEQLQDAYLEERLHRYLHKKIGHTQSEMKRLEGMGDEPRRRLASFFRDQYRGLLRDFEERFRGRMMEVLAEGMDAGAVEVLASAATHGHLPSLGSNRNREAQIGIGLESYRRCFGRDPRGFWLPECSYTPELDEVLKAFSPPLSHVVLDFTTAADPAVDTACTWEPRLLGSTPLLVLLRDKVAHDLVWTMEGYPSGGEYRDFAKRDHDGHGFQYWRITSLQTPLDEKDIYNPERATSLAQTDARDFAAKLKERSEEVAQSSPSGIPSMLLAAYDTELMGHWWREGPYWLREVLRVLGEDTKLPAEAAANALCGEPEVISPSVTAWTLEGDFSTWINPRTAEVWKHIHQAEADLEGLVSARGGNPQNARALKQAARELLLMESSDWTFMITRDTAAAYARDRFEAHHSRFHSLKDMIDRGDIEEAALEDLEDTDNIFPWLTIRHWQ